MQSPSKIFPILIKWWMIINLDYSEWWAERLARSNKGWVEASRTQGELCAHLQMCEVVKWFASLEGPRGPEGSVQVFPYRSSPPLPLLVITALSLMCYSILFKNPNLSSDTCRWLVSVFPVVSRILYVWFLCYFLNMVGFSGCFVISSRCTPPLSVCARLAPCLVVQTNMINEAIGVSRMSCDQRAFDVWHF